MTVGIFMTWGGCTILSAYIRPSGRGGKWRGDMLYLWSIPIA